MIATIPLGRMADPDETASAALFLASGESSFVNGSFVRRRWIGTDMSGSHLSAELVS